MKENRLAFLPEKILSLSKSRDFFEKFSEMANVKIRNGLLVLWFHDTDNYRSFRPKLNKAMISVTAPRARTKQKNRLFILDNYDILRLASVVNVLDSWNLKNNPQGDPTRKVKFYYPTIIENPIKELEVLSLELIYSKLVICSAFERIDGTNKPVYLIFYFGQHTTESYEKIRETLLSCRILKMNTKIYLYYYQRDDSFLRKIEPEIMKIFEKEEYPKFEMRSMNVEQELPPWIVDISRRTDNG